MNAMDGFQSTIYGVLNGKRDLWKEVRAIAPELQFKLCDLD